MTPQVHLALEGSATLVTGERLEARVFAGMSDEVGALAKGLAADGALVGLLSCKT